MSRAFTKERDDAPEPEVVAPARTGPNLLTAAGLEQLRARFDRRRKIRASASGSSTASTPPS